MVFFLRCHGVEYYDKIRRFSPAGRGRRRKIIFDICSSGLLKTVKPVVSPFFFFVASFAVNTTAASSVAHETSFGCVPCHYLPPPRGIARAPLFCFPPWLSGPASAHAQRSSTSTNKKTSSTSSAASAFSARCNGAAPNMAAAKARAAAEKSDSEIESNPTGFPPESALHPELQEAMQAAAAAAGEKKILKSDAKVSAGDEDRIPDFNDAAASYASFSTTELIRYARE